MSPTRCGRISRRSWTWPTATDANGEYLFAGTSTRPGRSRRARPASNYLGDQTTRQIRISNTQSLADVHVGRTLHGAFTERNGVFRTTVAATNTGNATISRGQRWRTRAWVRGQLHAAIHQRHGLAGGRRRHADARGDRVGLGIHLRAEHQLPGRERRCHGHAGRERFVHVTPAQNTDIFAMLDELARTLEGDTAIAGSQAAFTAQIGAPSPTSIRRSDAMVNVRAEVGTRLQAIDTATDFRDSEEVDLQR
jgi:flagellar hook-associated protein 3 FlgL